MRIFPLGESALTVEFGNEISLEMNERSIALVKYLSADPFPGFVEAVPGYSSVTIFYDLLGVRQAFPDDASAFNAIEKIIREAVNETGNGSSIESRTVEISVIFDDNCSLDIASVCEFSDLDTNQIIDLFLSTTYRVYMLGFLPGFAYMGEVDERIAAPRLKTPRTKVPKGSVGIAGKQTGIYPLESPGGWNIIGRTEVSLFDTDASEPCLLKPGDEVRFVRV